MKKWLVIILSIVMFILVGCNKVYIESESVGDREIAINKVEQYLFRIQKGDLYGADEVLSKSIIDKANINKDLKILDFNIENDISSNDGIWVEASVVRGDTDGFCSLDKWFFKVKENKNEDYRITEIKGTMKKEISVAGNTLEILTAEEAQSEVVVTLDDLPRKIYVKKDKVQVEDLKIPLNKFDKIGTSFNGNFIAFSTTNDKDCFIGVAFMENAKAAFSNNIISTASGGSKEISESDLKKDFGKPIAKKVAYFDLLKDSKIEKLTFSEEANSLIVQYRGKDNSSQVNIYELPDGDLLPLNLNETFPPDRYTVEYVTSIKSDILLFVNKKPGINGIHQELLGEYIVDLKEKTIDKI